MSASGPIRRLSISLEEVKELEKLSPFELKDKVMQVAGETGQQNARAMLNAGRGNPNWIATTPRDAFFTLGQFAIEESKRVWNMPDLGGMPQKPGIAQRLKDFAATHDKTPGIGLLTTAVVAASSKYGFDADAFVYELVDGIIGDQYPTPGRMLVHAEKVVHEYLVKEMCAGDAPAGRFDIFAVEGGTAAMCYIFDSLMVNHLLHRGDKVALALPMFTPYIEVAHLDRFHFDVVQVNANEVAKEGPHTWQYPDSEIDKLKDPSIKALFFVNPSNPPSVAMRAESMERLSALIQTKRPDLMIVTDDVYGTFVPGFRSLMANVPHNTIGVYSYSKYFGCTGWRLGVVAIHQDNIFDKMIAKLPVEQRNELNARYGPITLEPEKIKFIDRMVADSRCVALNHTAGLSLPQQVQMTLFSLFALLDKEDRYKHLTQSIVHKRRAALWNGMGLEAPQDPNHSEYYTTLDLMVWAEKVHGPKFAEFLRKNYHPFDVLFALAERYSTVLMNGNGFAGPEWSVRVSLANLPEDAYPNIGKQLASVVQAAVDAWKSQETS